MAWRAAMKKQVLLANQSFGPATDQISQYPVGLEPENVHVVEPNGWTKDVVWSAIPSGSLGECTLERLVPAHQSGGSSAKSSDRSEDALRVRCVVRSSPLETFISVMSEARVASAHGVVAEGRVVESVDDHTDVVYFATKPLPVLDTHKPHKVLVYINLLIATTAFIYGAYRLVLAAVLMLFFVIFKMNKTSAISQPRDFCVLRRWHVNRNGSYRICYDSIKGGHPACPLIPGRIRATIHQVFTIRSFLPRHARTTSAGDEDPESLGEWESDATDGFTSKLAELVASAETTGAEMLRVESSQCYLSLSIQVDYSHYENSHGLTSLLIMQALDVRDTAEAPRFLSVFFENQRNQMLLAGQGK
mmetsp:Transcript_37314/g.48276  ORF Transcript_37314/g.48276 Transcript_37314/m.48276 type:complete len:361 (+) Transcript_37314:1-1083(+)